MIIHHIEELLNQGKYNQALEEVNELDEVNKFEGKLYAIRIAVLRRELQHAEVLIQEIQQMSLQENNKAIEFAGYVMLALLQEKRNEHIKGVQSLTRAEEILNTFNLEQKKRIRILEYKFWVQKGWLLMHQGKIAEASDAVQKHLALGHLIPYQIYAVESLGDFGALKVYAGLINEGLEYFLKSVELIESTNNYTVLGTQLSNTATVYGMKGNYALAHKYHEEAIAAYAKSETPTRASLPYNNVGFIYESQGDLDKALQFYKEAMALADQPDSLVSMGRILIKQNNIAEGLTTLDQGLERIAKSSNFIQKTSVLFSVIVIHLELKNIEKAKKYFAELEKLALNQSSILIDARSRLAKALILKNSKSIEETVNARNYLEEIIKQEIPENLLTIAYLHLVDLLLDELAVYQSEVILNRIVDLLNEVQEVAQEQHNHVLIIEVLILRSKFDLLQRNISAALDKLEFARLSAVEKGLNVMEKRVKDVQDQIKSELSKWHKLIEKDVSLKKILDQVIIEDYIQGAIKIAAIDPQ